MNLDLYLSLNLNTYELNMYLISLFMYSYFRDDLPKYFKYYFTLNKNKYNDNTHISITYTY